MGLFLKLKKFNL